MEFYICDSLSAFFIIIFIINLFSIVLLFIPFCNIFGQCLLNFPCGIIKFYLASYLPIYIFYITSNSTNNQWYVLFWFLSS